MKTSAIILAGGFSKRFGQDKCLIELAGKPLIFHVLDNVSKVIDEALVVVSSEGQRHAVKAFARPKIMVIIDRYSPRSPLAGALTGFENAFGEYSLLLPCDTPFVSKEIVSLLLDLCVSRSAAIPRWPNRYIEPLHAVYHTKSALNASKTAYDEKKFDLRSMISNLTGVRYVSTLALQQLDPKLTTFFNVNTPRELKKAESMLKQP